MTDNPGILFIYIPRGYDTPSKLLDLFALLRNHGAPHLLPGHEIEASSPNGIRGEGCHHA